MLDRKKLSKKIRSILDQKKLSNFVTPISNHMTYQKKYILLRIKLITGNIFVNICMRI